MTPIWFFGSIGRKSRTIISTKKLRLPTVLTGHTTTREDREAYEMFERFAEPKDILDASDLSRDQKIGLLNQWKQDLQQLIVASGEGMAARHPGRAAELLRNVEAASRQL